MAKVVMYTSVNCKHEGVMDENDAGKNRRVQALKARTIMCCGVLSGRA